VMPRRAVAVARDRNVMATFVDIVSTIEKRTKTTKTKLCRVTAHLTRMYDDAVQSILAVALRLVILLVVISSIMRLICEHHPETKTLLSEHVLRHNDLCVRDLARESNVTNGARSSVSPNCTKFSDLTNCCRLLFFVPPNICTRFGIRYISIFLFFYKKKTSQLFVTLR
jgi:hypothetical protein